MLTTMALSRVLTAACVAGTVLFAGGPTHGRAATQNSSATAGDPRQPLLVEMWGFRFREPEIWLEAPPPDSIVFRLPVSVVGLGRTGAIKPTINGDPAATVCQVARISTDYAMTCDMRRHPLLALRPGRNELRVTVDGTPSEASYVVFLEGPPSSGRSTPPVAREVRRANDRADSTPPTVEVSRPDALDTAGSSPRTVSIAGESSDDDGVVAVTVNGHPVRLRRAARDRRSNPNAVAFAHDIQMPVDASQIAVEARDQAGNLTRVLLKSTVRPALAVPFSGRRAAIIVGVSEYRSPRDGMGNLRFAALDAQAVYELLVDPSLGGFSSGDVVLLQNEQATVPAVRDALSRVAGRLGPEDLLFVYINAHGAADPYVKVGSAPFYFLLHDTRLSDLPRTGYPMTAIEEIVNAAPFRAGRKVILVDACHSGAVGIVRDLSKAASRELERAAQGLARQQGVALMTSSAANQVSMELKIAGSGRGAFTLALLDGLRGSADSNRDAVITAGELFARVSTCVRELTGGRQHPQALLGSNAALWLTSALASAAPAGAESPRCPTGVVR